MVSYADLARRTSTDKAYSEDVKKSSSRTQSQFEDLAKGTSTEKKYSPVSDEQRKEIASRVVVGRNKDSSRPTTKPIKEEKKEAVVQTDPLRGREVIQSGTKTYYVTRDESNRIIDQYTYDSTTRQMSYAVQNDAGISGKRLKTEQRESEPVPRNKFGVPQYPQSYKDTFREAQARSPLYGSVPVASTQKGFIYSRQGEESEYKLFTPRPIASAQEGGTIKTVDVVSVPRTVAQTKIYRALSGTTERTPIASRIKYFATRTVPAFVGKVTQPARTYLQFLSSRVEKFPETKDLGSRGNVTYTVYKPLSPRTDVGLYAAVRNLYPTYTAVQKKSYQEDPAIKPLRETATFGLNLAASGGDVATRNIPLISQGYSSTADVVVPYAQTWIDDPVKSYALVRLPLKFLGKVGYKILDVADVAGSVIEQSIIGFKSGGIAGAFAGGIGGYVGEKLSDKSAVVAAKRPQFVRKSLSGAFATLTEAPNDGPVTFSYKTAPTTNKNMLIGRETSPLQYQVISQYRPRKVYGTTFEDVKGLGTVKQRFSVTLPARESDKDGVYYETTEPPAAKTEIVSTQLVSLEPRRESVLKSKRASFALSSDGDTRFDSYNSPNYQGTIQPTLTPEIETVFINKNMQQALRQPYVQLKAKSPSALKTIYTAQALPQSSALPKDVSLLRTSSVPNMMTQSQTRSSSFTLTSTPTISETFSPSLTPTLSVSPTISQTVTVSPTLTETLTVSPTFTPSITPTRTHTPTITQTVTPTLTQTPDKKKKRRKAYRVYVRRRGKYNVVASNVTRGEALNIGSRTVRNTAAATFKLQEIGLTDKADTTFSDSLRDFTVRNINTYIQKASKRISSFGEKQEITKQGLLKVRRRGKQNGFLSRKL